MKTTPWKSYAVAALCLAPSAAWANGFGHVETGLNITVGAAAAGCLIGITIALVRRRRTVGLFGWTILSGLALGLAGTLISVAGSESFFFPNNPEFAMLIAVSGVLVAGVGGGLLALVVWAIRAAMRGTARTGDGLPPPAPPQ